MLLGEPPRTQGDLNFSLFRIPIRVHPFFWLIAVLLGMNSGSAQELLVWIVALFVAILVHELGHAVAMRLYGYQPWITLYGLGGVTSRNASPFGRAGHSGPMEQILVSFAGPGAGFLLAGLIIGGIILSGHQIAFTPGGAFGVRIAMEEIGSATLTELLFQMLFISTIWGAVNLLPVYPLDGGHIAREILVTVNPGEGIRHSLMLSIFTAVVMAVLGVMRFGSIWIAILFGYMAYISYVTLQAYTGRR